MSRPTLTGPFALPRREGRYETSDRPGELLYGRPPDLRDRVAVAMGQRAASRPRRRYRDGPNPWQQHACGHGPAFP
ncbi:MAG: hypothetical protein J2P14_13385 [Acidothermales bacterium]|nr:hypothetical protein [Acidothermales bacterium]